MTDTNTRCAAPAATRRTEDDQHTKTSDLTFRPPMDIHDLGDRYEIHVDMPGTKAEHIDVVVRENVLEIEARVPDRYPDAIAPIAAEFGVGDYRRRVRLGEDIDAESLEARYASGVLTLTLPKRRERQPRRIAVTGG